jgi:hypothetical protein
MPASITSFKNGGYPKSTVCSNSGPSARTTRRICSSPADAKSPQPFARLRERRRALPETRGSGNIPCDVVKEIERSAAAASAARADSTSSDLAFARRQDRSWQSAPREWHARC